MEEITKQDMLDTESKLESTTEKIGFVAHVLEVEANKDDGDRIFGQESFDLPGVATILNDCLTELYEIVLWLSENDIADRIDKASETKEKA